MTAIDGIPRRIRLDQLTPAETAIYEAVQAVEEAGADERLTRAVVLLGEARRCVADFVDGVERPDLTEPAEQKREKLPICGICGGRQVKARPQYPGGEERVVCPTCLADRLDHIREIADPQTYQACAAE